MHAINALRARFFIAKGLRPLKEIAAATHLSPYVLARFCRKIYVTEQALEAIEAWVEQQESPRVEPPGQEEIPASSP